MSYDYKPVATRATFKSELIDILQFLCVLVLFTGMVWAVINIQHPSDYYTSEGTQ
jgi:hypothetical protein